MTGTLTLAGTPPLTIPAGAAAGAVAASDASGNVGWQAAPGLTPSGDTTGVKDVQNVQGLLNLAGVALLGPGTFWAGSGIVSPSNSCVAGVAPGVTTLKATTTLGGGIF